MNRIHKINKIIKKKTINKVNKIKKIRNINKIKRCAVRQIESLLPITALAYSVFSQIRTISITFIEVHTKLHNTQRSIGNILEVFCCLFLSFLKKKISA